MVFQSTGIFCSQKPTGAQSIRLITTTVQAVIILNCNRMEKVSCTFLDCVYSFKLLKNLMYNFDNIFVIFLIYCFFCVLLL